MSHSAENFRKEIPFFEKTSGFEKFYGWKGGYHVFPSKIFGLTVPKHFVEQAFCAAFQKTSGSEKVYG